MTFLLVLAGLYLFDRLWKQALIVRFFRRPGPSARTEPRLISVLQPILSGDPTLADCLETNLRLRCRWPLEFLYLIDDNDDDARRVCADLLARHPERSVRILTTPPPPDRHSPKLFKLSTAVPQAHGDVLCVLDDDTMLPDDGLEICVPYLDESGVGLAFGLPYYVSFANLWSSLVACFVNSHSLLTYVPPAFLTAPFTINGMCYVLRRSVYDAVGGFDAIQGTLADDFAVARLLRQHGYRLAQTPLCHPIRTHVGGARAYLRLLHRWFIFPRETLLKGLPWRALALVYGLTLPMLLIPSLLLLGLCLWPSWEAATATAACFAAHYLSFIHCDRAYLRRATPWRRSWMVPLLQLLLPLQLLAALLLPQRINWRGHILRIEKGGGFRFEPAEEALMPSWLRRNLLLMVPIAVVQTLAYLLLNHLALRPPRTLPMTPVDEAIPFLPWTVFPYLGLISSQATLPLLIRERTVIVRLTLAYGLAIPILFLTFLLWPTTYPRPPAPTGDGVDATVYRGLIVLDSPDCCCPSGHIVGPAIIFWSVWRDRRRGGVWLLLWFAAGAVSILTTKQHYLWDLLSGLALALLCLLAADRLRVCPESPSPLGREGLG